MEKILIVVDMQRDFIDGALGTAEAAAILPNVLNKIKNFEGRVLFTRDTHDHSYMDSLEGHYLPVPHCIVNTPGWEIHPELAPYANKIIDKPAFGSLELAEYLVALQEDVPIECIEMVGLCTDICVISNALILKAALPQVDVIVDASCCAGTREENHRTALKALEPCQVKVINANF